jgi:sulfur-oxidizing protein SoxB
MPCARRTWKAQEELATPTRCSTAAATSTAPSTRSSCDALRAELDAQVSLSPGFRWGTTVLPGEAITMDRVMDQTCMTYPETYVREMTGAEMRNVLESVADNLFNADPYYQQGGDMVRTGGFRYKLDPTAAMGSRVSEMTLAISSSW